MFTPRTNLSVVSGDTVGHYGNMHPDALCGIRQRGAELDLHSLERIGIIRAPNLLAIRSNLQPRRIHGI